MTDKFHESIEEQILNMSEQEKYFLAKVKGYSELEGEYKDKVDGIIKAVDLTDNESVINFGQEMVERVSGISEEAKAYLIENGYYTDEGDLGEAFMNALQGKVEEIKDLDKVTVINKAWEKTTQALAFAGKAKNGVASWFTKSHAAKKKREELKEKTGALRETLEEKAIEAKTISKKAQRNIDEIDQAINLINIQYQSRMNASTELKFYVIAVNQILKNYAKTIKDGDYDDFEIMNIEANEPNLKWRAKILTASYGKAMLNCKMLAQDKAKEMMSRQATLEKKNNAANDLKQGIFYGAMQEQSARRVLELAEWDASGIEMTEKIVDVRAHSSQQLQDVVAGDDLTLEELKALDNSVETEKRSQEAMSTLIGKSYEKTTRFLEGKKNIVDGPQLTSGEDTTESAVKQNEQDMNVSKDVVEEIPYESVLEEKTNTAQPN